MDSDKWSGSSFRYNQKGLHQQFWSDSFPKGLKSVFTTRATRTTSHVHYTHAPDQLQVAKHIVISEFSFLTKQFNILASFRYLLDTLLRTVI